MEYEKQNIKGYKIIKSLGSGGNGTAYLAEKENNNYVIKKIEHLLNLEIDNYQNILKVLCKIKRAKKQKEVLPRFELGLMDSKSSVLTVTP